MNPAESVQLTGYLQAYFPQQAVSEFTPEALHELLEPYSLADCRAAILARAMRLQNTEGAKWCAPTDVYAEVRRARSKAIASDEPIPMPPDLDPDDTAAYVRVLTAGRQAQIDGREFREMPGVARAMELMGPRSISEAIEDRPRKRGTQIKPKVATEPTEAIAAEPVVFACENVVDGELCGDPARHLSADRRRPLCDDHAETEEGAA